MASASANAARNIDKRMLPDFSSPSRCIRRLDLYVGPRDLHVSLGVRDRSEAKLIVEIMGVSCCEGKTANSLKRGVIRDHLHEEFRETTSAMRLEDEDLQTEPVSRQSFDAMEPPPPSPEGDATPGHLSDPEGPRSLQKPIYSSQRAGYSERKHEPRAPLLARICHEHRHDGDEAECCERVHLSALCDAKLRSEKGSRSRRSGQFEGNRSPLRRNLDGEFEKRTAESLGCYEPGNVVIRRSWEDECQRIRFAAHFGRRFRG